MGINAAYAALFEPSIQHLDLADLSKSHAEGPDYLNVLKIWDIPQLLEQLQLEPGQGHDVYSTRGQYRIKAE